MTWAEFISLRNIYRAWCDFSRGKRSKTDVVRFEAKLEDGLWQVIDSFHVPLDMSSSRMRGSSLNSRFQGNDSNAIGVPIGNLTSQVFANVYLHELDLFTKRTLKLRYYFRYADDVLILVEHRSETEELVKKIAAFLNTRLNLTLHPDKIIIRKNTWGIDWLGQVLLPGYRVLRPVFGEACEWLNMSIMLRCKRRRKDKGMAEGLVVPFPGDAFGFLHVFSRTMAIAVA